MAETEVNSRARKVFLTADDLQRRMESAGSGVIELAANEQLTPSAQDLAGERNVVVRRSVTAADAPDTRPIIKTDRQEAVAGLTSPGAQSGRAVISPVGLVIERPRENVVTLLQALRHDGAMFIDYSKTECWLRNTETLAGDIRGGRMAAGVWIMPYAANAMVLAGKCKGLRPVQGTRVESVAAGVRHYDANALVLEHRQSTFHEMRAMIRAFTAARSGPMNRDVADTIAQLERA